MKGFSKGLLILAAAMVFAVSCSKDEEVGSIAFSQSALFFDKPGDTATVSFTLDNISTYSITSKPTGWADPVINAAAQTITITAPASFEKADPVKSGTIILSGMVNNGKAASATLFVGVVPTVDLSGKTANSYIITKSNTRYTFDALHKGDGKTPLATASVGVVWQSMSSLIQYVRLENGKVSFYSESNSDSKFREGNAVIGAYNAAGTLIWSWHIWSSDYDPDKAPLVYKNGYTVMDRNLGALDNRNETGAQILASYGLYYQWGRKDPFIGPSSYRANSGASASMYNGSNNRVAFSTVESSAETGTMEYAIQNPVTFITGVEGSAYDWQWSGHGTTLWGTTKTVNDPCPSGWKVAPAAAFAGLSIKELNDNSFRGYEDKYGWKLTDGSVTSLYIGAGRRIYLNGKIENIYNPVPKQRNVAMEAQPWVGYYWFSDLSPANEASNLFFWYYKIDPAASGIKITSSHRSNGMTLRCVKEQ